MCMWRRMGTPQTWSAVADDVPSVGAQENACAPAWAASARVGNRCRALMGVSFVGQVGLGDCRPGLDLMGVEVIERLLPPCCPKCLNRRDLPSNWQASMTCSDESQIAR